MAGFSRVPRNVVIKGRIISLFVALCSLQSSSADIYECPDDWVEYDVKCYRFVFFPELDHDSARGHCGQDGASLLGVNTAAEHSFISNWLMNNDMSRREFYTSGLIRNLAEGDMVWESDGSRIPPEFDYWVANDKFKSGQFITYKYGVTFYGWSRAPANTLLPFICEISLEEAYRITDEKRDFDYGLNVSDPNEIPRGPKITKEPRNIMLVTAIARVVIECASFANPSPQYRMYRTRPSTGETVLITPDMDARYSLTNGMLTIQGPTETQDTGNYFCESTNSLGSVLSQAGTLYYGVIGEFSNVQREKVRVQEHHYGVIDCMPPIFKPAVAFGWMKTEPGNFIRTDLMLHIFPSYNGKLYFSEVGSSDAAKYYCMVKLMPERGSIFGTNQPPARVSMAIEMEVTDSMPKIWGPEIGNDFPAVFPNRPLRGQQIRLECLAFGTMPITYRWERDGGLPLPPSTELLEENRVLEIDSVMIEDSGNYTCVASRGGGASFRKSIMLNVNSKPYFIYALHDQHVDEGRRLTWRCEARGIPDPTYAWLKNGQVLSSNPGDVEISKNVLTVVSPDAARHNGMYQCRASNTHGTVYSTGQLRVLGFKPTFVKNPVLPKTMGALTGTVTIACSPEAAPRPTITWLKNGAQVGSPDVNARIRVLANGNIVISQLVTSDSGTYTCRAENSYGTTSSSGTLEVLGRTTISNRPANTVVLVNNTAFLACHTSHDPALDVETSWFFQGKPLNSKDLHYIRGSAGGISGLYIQGAQKQHHGLYTCRAKTTFDIVTANATLTVRAPPGEPGGLIVALREGLGSDTVTLVWTMGYDWGGAITHYTVQAATNYNATWRIIADNIPAASTAVPGKEKRETDIRDLNPWTGYRFRIAARNAHGLSPYSVPTSYYQTPMAPPRRAPTNITAGEGKVADLNITWVPLTPEEQGGPNFGYRIYFKRHGTNANYINQTVYGGDVRSYVQLIEYEFYYTLYDVIVQAFNGAGAGPNSSVATIYSAEDLPRGTPTNVHINRHNATALNISWTPVPNTREAMRGRILGYQVSYWEVSNNPLIMSHYTGEASEGATIIGLRAKTWYTMEVQVYNGAGLGPRSEQFHQRTWKSEILVQPTEVVVTSHGPNSVYVTWRGVTPRHYEESLLGYVMQYWPSTDNIRTASGEFTGLNNFGVIYGIQKNVLYKLRIYPYSRGGDGASSPDRLFTLGGQIRFDPPTTEILAGSSRPSWSLVLFLILIPVHV